MKAKANSKNCSVLAGPNTKQLWVYEEDKDIFIDPPADVLDECRKAGEDWDAQIERLESLVEEDPAWLQDQDYWYDGDIDP